jgi:hypothetical protein
MNEGFQIPVTYNGKEAQFPARLLAYGYSYKIEVEINDALILFEPDEERNWRAQSSVEDIEKNKKISTGLLEAIAHALEEITK